MIINCRNCGRFRTDEEDAKTIRLRQRSLMDPPTCPQCDDELKKDAFLDEDDEDEERLEAAADAGYDTREEYDDFMGREY